MTLLVVLSCWLLLAPVLAMAAAGFLRQADGASSGPWRAAEALPSPDAGVVPAPRAPLTVREHARARR